MKVECENQKYFFAVAFINGFKGIYRFCTPFPREEILVEFALQKNGKGKFMI